MADQIRKLKDEATQMLLKGRYEKAAGLFRKVLEQDPEDDSCRSKLGYLLQRMGRPQDAVDVFSELANHFAQRGFLLKAIATCKVVLTIDPDHTRIQRQLAELYAKRTQPTSRPPINVLADESPEPPAGGVMIGGPSTDPIELPLPTDGIALVDLSTSLPDEPPKEALPPEVELDLDFGAEEEAPSKRVQTLPEIPLFSDLDPDAFVTVLERMKLVRFRAGEWIIREGDQGTSMFAIARGSLRVLKALDGNKFVQLAVLGEGAFFGEMALLRGGPRSASVQALSAGELFEISRELIDLVVEQFPPVEEVLKKFAKQRLLRNVMATSALFRPFEPNERVRLIERFVSREVAAGDELITEGQESDGLYLVLRGRVSVSRRVGDDSDVELGVLQEGEVFGEISCLHQEAATATVRAATPATVLRLPRQAFRELILSHPQILELVHQLGEERRALTQNALAKKGVLI